MASTGGQALDEVLARLERRERTARWRALVFTLVPAVLAAALLSYTVIQVRAARAEKADLERQVTSLKRDVTSLQQDAARLTQDTAKLSRELEEARAKLRQSTDLSRFAHPINLVDAKMLASRNPEAWPALDQIIRWRQQGVGWRLGGRSPDVGFDSPGFAAFVLSRLGAPGGDVRPGDDVLETSGRLRERLQRVGTPRAGDLAFYEAGYALFYFLDERNRPFVIGMTPFGITALEPDFAKLIGYYRPSQ